MSREKLSRYTIVLAALAAAAISAATADAASVVSSNPAPITFPNGGEATTYPSEIAVSGQVGTVSDVNVTLRNFSQEYDTVIDVMLVSPDGSRATVFSDIANTGNNLTFTLDDEAPSDMSSNVVSSGTYRPTNNPDYREPADDGFPPPAPLSDGSAALSSFDGSDPNGAWRLYARADTTWTPKYRLDAFAGGWSLDIDVKPPAPCTIGGTDGPDLITGTPRRDIICGFGGDDRLRGMEGDDTLIGGLGSDNLTGGYGRDNLKGGPKRDSFNGGPGRDVCDAVKGEKNTSCER